LTLVGKDLIRLLLGPNWGTAGEIFTYFAPGIGVMIVYYIHGWIHVSIGRADRWFLWSLVEWAVTLGAFLVGLPYGPQGIAVAWCVSYWILAVPGMWYAGKPIGLGVGQVVGVVWRYVFASAGAGAVTFFASRSFTALAKVPGGGGAALRIVCVTAVFGALYLCAVVILHGGTEPLRRILRLVGELRGKGRAVAAAQNTPTGGVGVA
jgi:O-antigen/teichoic acid export membrane protein